MDGFLAPVTEWYTMEYPTSTNRRRIESATFAYRNRSQDITNPLPPGWSRKEFNSDFAVAKYKHYHHWRAAAPRDFPKYCYTHVSSPDEWFWYPTPVTELTSDPVIQKQTQFLFCQTTRAFFYGGSRFGWDDRLSKEMSRGPEWIRIRDLDGNLVGSLCLHSKQDLELFQDEPSPGKRIELVATSKGYTGRIYQHEVNMEWSEENPPKPILTDCYYVLWIEWEDGIAYRKASGVVASDVWDREKECDLVDLTLG